MNRHEITARVHNKWYWKWATLQNMCWYSVIVTFCKACKNSVGHLIPFWLFYVWKTRTFLSYKEPFSHTPMGNFIQKWLLSSLLFDQIQINLKCTCKCFQTTSTTKPFLLQTTRCHLSILILWSFISALANKYISRVKFND